MPFRSLHQVGADGLDTCYDILHIIIVANNHDGSELLITHVHPQITVFSL